MRSSAGNERIKLTSVFGVNLAFVPVGYAVVNGISSIENSGALSNSEGTSYQVNALSPNGRWLVQAYAGQIAGRPFAQVKKINDDGIPQYPSAGVGLPNYNSANFVQSAIWHPFEEMFVIIGSEGGTGINKLVPFRRNTSFSNVWDAGTAINIGGAFYASGGLQGMEWSPNGKYLIAKVYNSSGGYVKVFSYNGSSFTEMSTYPGNLFFNGSSDVRSFKYSPDGKYLAVINNNGYYVNIGTTQTDQFIDNSNTYVQDYMTGYQPYCIAWSPDSKIIAVGFKNGFVGIMSTSGNWGNPSVQYFSVLGGTDIVRKLWWDKSGSFLYMAWGQGSIGYIKRVSDTTVQNYHLSVGSGSLTSVFGSDDEAWQLV